MYMIGYGGQNTSGNYGYDSSSQVATTSWSCPEQVRSKESEGWGGARELHSCFNRGVIQL